MGNNKTIVIGSGFSSLSAAAVLAKAGKDVTVLEKNDGLGGRARVFHADGFTFDMGPSWYWMPEVFEQFFNRFGHTASDYYQLVRLDPSYRVVFGKDDFIDIPADFDKLCQIFEGIESGSAVKLRKFMDEAAYKYKVGINEFVWKPSLSILEFADLRILKSMFGLQMFSSIAAEIRSKFQNEKLRKILEFPVLFLGATPENTPALYSLMNYADLKLGTWYPIGGMHKIIEGFVQVCKEQGVKFETNAEVANFDYQNGEVSRVHCKDGRSFECDAVVSGADYEHIDQKVTDPAYRNYSEAYWDKRVMAPSSLLFYLGYNRKIPLIKHHTLYFDEDFAVHADEIYTNPKWPTKPLFYICAPSVTDQSVAPDGAENLFVLIPTAPNLLNDDEAIREKYFEIVVQRVKSIFGIDLKDGLVYRRSYCTSDFIKDYHAFRGNAYGLANTLLQTAFLKPRVKSKKCKNLYFVGQLTAPGPGMPPSIISGQMVADLLLKEG